MEGIESVALEKLEVSNERIGLSNDARILSNNSFKGSDITGNELAHYEKFILDDLDNYWDEINDRLTVSRMVSDSVIKGIVHAVVDESAEKIASQEEEIASLNEKLQSHEFNSAIGNHSSLNGSVKCNYSENLGRLRIIVEKQLHRLKEHIQNFRISNSHGRINCSSGDVGLCSILPQARMSEKLMDIDESIDTLRVIVATVFEDINSMFHSTNASVFEHQWKLEFQREINSIVIENSVRGLRDEFETKMYEQRRLINELNMNWKQKIAELSTMREDLDAISRSLLSSESGQLFSHESLDSLEDKNTTKRRDQFPQKLSASYHLTSTPEIEENGAASLKKSVAIGKTMLEVADFSQLKHMSKEELTTHYKNEMTKVRRQHDLALQETTEELFRLKREFLKEKGSLPFRKDKEFELLKKKIPEVILKLDDILLEKDKLPSIQHDYDELSNLKGRIDSLFSDNQRLRGLLAEKRKEVKFLSSQVSDAASQMSHHSTAEAKILKQIKKLKRNLEDVKIENEFKDQLHSIVLKEVIAGYKYGMEDVEIEATVAQEIYSVALKGFVSDAKSTINSIVLKDFTEKSSLEALLFEKEKALCVEIEDNKKSKQVIALLSTVMKEKEKFALDTRLTLMQQKAEFDLLNQEVIMLRDQVSEQEILISKYQMESDSSKSRLNETLQQLYQCKREVNKLNDKLVITSNALEEAEKKKSMLCGIIEDKEKKVLSLTRKENQQSKQMDSIITSVMELSKASVNVESKLAENIGRYESRLKILKNQCSLLVQQATLLRKKSLWYKQMLDIKLSDLQKAEAEVDLLGDEVDTLLSLLGKIYIALDHYSPVLQHYPGVMEILKLVQRELEGETTR